ncbi:MAG TPA: low affinity iron permease family protein [Solirubrobacteraceae bacterium]
MPVPSSPFSRVSTRTAHSTGHPMAFVLAALAIVVRRAIGPRYAFGGTGGR